MDRNRAPGGNVFGRLKYFSGMEEAKTVCTKCGSEILVATAKRTGGICMACKNGPPSEWARRRLWQQHGADPLAGIPWHQSPWGKDIMAICQKLAAREIGCVEGSRKMAALAEIVLDAAHGDKWVHKDWEIFEEVRCAAFQLPFGETRLRWSEDALRMKDNELQAIENSYSGRVRDAALKLLENARQTGS